MQSLSCCDTADVAVLAVVGDDGDDDAGLELSRIGLSLECNQMSDSMFIHADPLPGDPPGCD